ncbi:TonB-dependent receptor domain-containing protein [Variovorax sp. YR216]|uniref:TonB-dependent receptor domain-containing protein n=1 Tax=Variovorax sp. YR216 TaxID=1882828 RepID=UPI00089D97DC|nr:TonB-dependent receptor [Variovorax sp. YR216]SEA10787.1 vitamin B12 transporter [Variovorax sp. YR216]
MKTSVFFHRTDRCASSWPLAGATHISLAVAALSGVSSVAMAQSAPTLTETVVTATRTPTRVDDLVSDTVVIDRAQIEQQASRTLPEILARVAGVQISANGGAGKSSSVYIRGAEARHTILLIDGVRYGSATLGTPNWDNIPVEMIDRIEVVKGPASALYGSDGVGGVVQIFTRKAAAGDSVFMPRASTTLGSESYKQITGGFSGASGAATYSLDVQRTIQDSFSATNSRVQFGNYNPDRDPFNQSAANASFGYQFNPDWKLDAGLLYSDGLNRFDDGPGRDSRNTVRTQTAYVGASGKVMSNWNTQLRYARSEDKTQNIVAAPGNVPGLFETTQNQYLWQNDIATPVGTVIAGLERLEQNVNSDTRYTVTDRDINSAFVGLNGDQGAHSWQLNARHDDNSQFGGNDTWFAGYGYRITQNWRVNVSHGTSFVAPSFNQLYYPGFGNPNLKPEEGKNTDLGITWSQGGHTVKLVGYDNKITGFITNETLPQNIPRARIQGGTLSYDGQFGNLGLHASYDSLDPHNEVTGKQLPRRAKDQATLGADYQIGAWKLGGSALYVGQRYDDAANTRVLNGYTTVDLYVEYRVAKDWSVQGRVSNIGDVNYETAWGYNQPGRAFYLTLRWQPK